jgi:hypothetical protein
MKTTLGVAIAAAAMFYGAGLANAATVSSGVHALAQLSSESSATQHIVYHRWHHRHCWWRHGHRHCRY